MTSMRAPNPSFHFQFSDVNAFLTLAATSHTLHVEDLLNKPRSNEIVEAARAGRVPVRLVSSKSMIVSNSGPFFETVIHKITPTRTH